jgi:hypothetical protein
VRPGLFLSSIPLPNSIVLCSNVSSKLITNVLGTISGPNGIGSGKNLSQGGSMRYYSILGVSQKSIKKPLGIKSNCVPPPQVLFCHESNACL